jgi:hypothetical protein
VINWKDMVPSWFGRLQGPPAKGFPGSQPNASGSSVESTRPAAAMESHPQGAAGSTPKRGATPVSNGRGFAFRKPVNRLSLAEQSYKGLPQWKTSKCLKIVLSWRRGTKQNQAIHPTWASGHETEGCITSNLLPSKLGFRLPTQNVK